MKYQSLRNDTSISISDWSRAEAAAFLEDSTIPIRVACHILAGSLWMLSQWYRYCDERFEMSTNAAPHCEVKGAGKVSMEVNEGKAVLWAVIGRYLGVLTPD